MEECKLSCKDRFKNKAWDWTCESLPWNSKEETILLSA